jgi:hypothetical protein
MLRNLEIYNLYFLNIYWVNQTKEDEKSARHVKRNKNLVRKLKKINLVKGIDERILLKWIVTKYGVKE